MKKILLILAIALCATAVMADGFAYLVLQKENGTTVSLSTSDLSISYDRSSSSLTVNGTAYAVSDLAYMFFTNTAVNEVTIPSVGWVTFCSSDALNYAAVSGLTAYTATFSDKTLTLHELTEGVPAGTGIILQGEAGTYSVPVVAASSVAEAAYNDLTGTTSAVVAADYCYALTQLNESSVGFKLVSSGVTIPANKAYYHSASISRELYTIDSDATVTGILETTEAAAADATVYDLQGRRVGSFGKGLYIKNGKKYLVK